MNTNTRTQTALSIASVSYSGNEPAAFNELQRLAELVGVEISVADGLAGTKGILQFTTENCAKGKIKASFHELFQSYFTTGSVELDYRKDTAEILELLVAVGATERGKIIGVIGAQGGVGATTLGLWVARELKRHGKSSAFIDLDPLSIGVDTVISTVQKTGKRWADLSGTGAVLAGKLNEVLPRWKGVKIVTADERGGVSQKTDIANRTIAAVAQLNDFTILDLARSATLSDVPAHAWLGWCDQLLLLTNSDTLALIRAQKILQALQNKLDIAVVGFGVKSRAQLANMAQILQHQNTFSFRKSRNFIADLEHSMAPGDRARSVSARDVKEICADFILSAL